MGTHASGATTTGRTGESPASGGCARKVLTRDELRSPRWTTGLLAGLAGGITSTGRGLVGVRAPVRMALAVELLPTPVAADLGVGARRGELLLTDLADDWLVHDTTALAIVGKLDLAKTCLTARQPFTLAFGTTRLDKRPRTRSHRPTTAEAASDLVKPAPIPLIETEHTVDANWNDDTDGVARRSTKQALRPGDHLRIENRDHALGDRTAGAEWLEAVAADARRRNRLADLFR